MFLAIRHKGTTYISFSCLLFFRNICSLQRSLTWSEVGLHEGQDGVAGRQVTDTDAHKVFAHLRLPEQLIELRKEETEW